MEAELVLLHIGDGCLLAFIRIGEESEELTVAVHIPAEISHVLEAGGFRPETPTVSKSDASLDHIRQARNLHDLWHEIGARS